MSGAAAGAMELLLDAGRVLGASLDYEATLRSLARLTLPALADACGVHVVGEDGVLRRIALLVWDLGRGAIVERDETSWRVPLPSGFERVITKGETSCLPDILLVPLCARGAVLGAISLVRTTSDRRYGPEDVALAEDLGRRAGMAVDNARLHAEVLRAARRSEEAYDALERRVEERTRALSAANAELRRREAQLAQAETLAHMGSWEWDPETGRTVMSAELYRIFGEDPERFTPALEVLLARTHLDDRPLMEAWVNRALGSDEVSGVEYRIHRADGAERVLLGRGQVLVREEGRVRMVGVVRDITEEKAAEQRLRASLREKEVLLREVHHRVKNNLQVISSLLQLQRGYVDDPRLIELIRESQTRVQTIALVHEAIYRSSDLAWINLKEYLHRLVAALLGVYQADAAQVEIHADAIRLGMDAVIHCGLIVNELVTNVFKHAYPEGRGGTVRIGVERSGEGEAILSVADRGVGLPPGLDLAKARSLGFRLVTTLAEQLGGSIEVGRDGGTRIAIRMPIAPAEGGPGGEVGGHGG